MSLKRKAALGVIAIAVVAITFWLRSRQPAMVSGEPRLDLPVICAECGNSLRVDYDGLMKMMADARAKGVAVIDGEPRSPVGICSKCGKAALYRAEVEPQTGRPALPAFARRDKSK